MPASRGSGWFSCRVQGMVHGCTDAIWPAVGILVLAAATALTLVNAGRPGSTTVTGSGCGCGCGAGSEAASGEGVEDEVAVPAVAH
jgi:hypothetical protein